VFLRLVCVLGFGQFSRNTDFPSLAISFQDDDCSNFSDADVDALLDKSPHKPTGEQAEGMKEPHRLTVHWPCRQCVGSTKVLLKAWVRLHMPCW
jgi:hypothetical protein